MILLFTINVKLIKILSASTIDALTNYNLTQLKYKIINLKEKLYFFQET